jgi:hypothetical protein
MPRCIYSKNEFAESDAEHVLQNFLGARWTSREIVCDELQAVFGATIDAALERSLQPIRNLFGTRGGRGGAGPVLRNLQASSGEVLDLEPGFQPRLRQPIVTVTDQPDGRHLVRMQLGVLGHLGWALNMLRTQVPQLMIDESTLRPLPRAVENYIQGTVELNVGVGGHEYFRGMLKACFNRLGVANPNESQLPCFDGVREFVRVGSGQSQSYVRWIATPDRLAVPRLGPIDQAVFITTRGRSVEGVVQFFGDIVHSFQLSDSYNDEPIHCGYVVDPLREADPPEMRGPTFDAAAIPAFAEQAPTNTPDIQAAFQKRLQRIMRAFYDHAHKQIVERTIQEVLGDHMGEPFSDELARRLAVRLAERIARRGG